MIENKLLYFKHYSAFQDALDRHGIADTSIAFIEDTRSIYTHGTYFNTSESDISNIVSQYLSGIYSRSAIDSLLGNKQDKLVSGTNIKTINGQSLLGSGDIDISEGLLYMAGLGININGSTISLKPATVNELGGIRLGYSASGKTYPVLVDGNNRAYVSVPWESTSGEGEKGDNGGYYEIIFKACAEGVTPTLPVDFANNNEGWLHYVVDDDSTPIVWMANRFVDGNGNVNSWQGPWRITGPQGDEGADGDEFEYIYARTTVEDSNILSDPNSGVKSSEFKEDGITPMSASNTPAGKDFVPAGWTDSPRGIDFTNKYEWMCLRQYNGVTKTWGRFIGPVLWSAYGRTGTDGDGVEYIYYAVQSGTWANSPTSWTSDANFQNREYIREGSGWVDNPVDMSTLNPGAKQWVSVRKRYADANSVNGQPYWHAYSVPALWSYYPHDGDAGIGVVADFDNDMMAISMDSNGMNYAFQQNATLHMYNGASEVTIKTDSGNAPTIISVVDASGNAINNANSYFSIASGTATLSVNVPAAALDLESCGTIFVTMRAKCEINGAEVTRDAVLQIIGFKFGSDGNDGCSYSLKVSTSAIKIYKDNTKAPSTISCACKRTEGTTPLEEWTPSTIVANSSARWDNEHYMELRYSIDGATEVKMTSNSISTASIADNIVFSLVYCVVNNGNVTEYYVDREVVYVILDGSDGVSPVTYNIQVTGSTLTKNYNPNTISGTVEYKIQRVEGNNRSFITNANSYSISTRVYFGGNSSYAYNVTPVYNSSRQVWSMTIPNSYSWNDTYHNFVEIVALDINNAIVASTVVPTRIPGEKGDSANVQALNLSVMRVRTWSANATPAWNNGSVAENGIYYTDIAVYGNSYYRCLRAGTTAEPSYQGGSDWELFAPSGQAAFEYMIANSAYIQSLTSKLVIITNASNVPVAGMIDGQYIPNELTGSDNTITNTNGIRIFAGQAPTNGDFSNTAFTVDENGNVRAAGGKIMLNADGSGQIANGNITWDKDGKFNFSVDNGGFTDVSNTNILMITNLYSTLDSYSATTIDDYRANTYKIYCLGHLVKNGVIRGFYNFTFYLYDLYILSKILKAKGYTSYIYLPEAILAATNYDGGLQSAILSKLLGLSWAEFMGTDDIWMILPNTYIPKLTSSEIYPTRWFFDTLRQNASNNSLSHVWASRLYTPSGTKFSELPQVLIVYTANLINPGNPTSDNMGVGLTWDRNINNAKWCAYRQKVDGEWTNWTVEQVSFE